MLKYSLSLALLLLSHNADATLKMSHKIDQSELNNKNCLTVESRFLLDESGTIILHHPAVFEGSINVNGNPGFKVDTNYKDSIQISSTPLTEVCLKYQNCFNDFKGNLSYPFFSQSFTSYTPASVLFLPSTKNSQDWDISFDSGQIPGNHIPYTELASNRTTNLFVKGADFMASTFATGTIKPILKSDKNFNVKFILKGAPVGYPKDYVDDFFNILKLQNSFWPKNYDLNTTVILDFDNQLESTSGFHSPNAFIISFSKKHKYWVALATFSHENFHQWLGSKLRFPANNEYTWIMEGLTDYMGVTLSHQNELINDQQYLNLLNHYLVHLHCNPLQKYSYTNLISHPTSPIESYKAIIYRTHLASLAIESTLNLPLSESPIGLAIKDLFIEAPEAEHGQVGEVVVQKVFKRHFTEENWKTYQEMITGTHSVQLPATLFKGRARLIKKDLHVSDLGFDLHAFFVENKIKNLSKNSSAYKAGLREDQKVSKHRVHLSEPDYKCEIIVQDDERHQTITFIPKQTRTITVEQYELVERPGSQPLLRRH